MTLSANQRFEIIGDLYYRRHHCLRPGKYESPITGRDSGSEENKAQFDNWVTMCAFNDALERIAELEAEVSSLEAA